MYNILWTPSVPSLCFDQLNGISCLAIWVRIHMFLLDGSLWHTTLINMSDLSSVSVEKPLCIRKRSCYVKRLLRHISISFSAVCWVTSPLCVLWLLYCAKCRFHRQPSDWWLLLLLLIFLWSPQLCSIRLKRLLYWILDIQFFFDTSGGDSAPPATNQCW